MKANNNSGSEAKPEFLKNRKKPIFRKPKEIDEGDLPKLGENPFKESWSFNAMCSSTNFRLTKRKGKKSYTIYTANEEGLNEVLEGNFTPYLLEGKYTRIHMENNQGLRKKIYQLEPCSHTILFWIIFSMDYGKDYMLLNKQNLMKELNLSKDTVYKAINQLIEEGFIKKTKVLHYYWINAQFLFFGNRCHYFPEKVTSQKGATIEDMRNEFLFKNKKQIEARLAKLRGKRVD